MRRLLILLVLAVGPSAAAQGPPQSAGDAISLAPEAWASWRHDGWREDAVQGGAGQYRCGEALCVDLPLWRRPADSALHAPTLDYLTTAAPADLSGATAVSLTFDVEASPGALLSAVAERALAGCRDNPQLRLYFGLPRSRWMSGPMTLGDTRWWSNPASVPLSPVPQGAQTLTVPLRPGLWSSVWGDKGDASAASKAGFAATLEEAMVGFTLGGCGAFGHGVGAVGGKVTIRIDSLTVERAPMQGGSRP